MLRPNELKEHLRALVQKHRRLLLGASVTLLVVALLVSLRARKPATEPVAADAAVPDAGVGPRAPLPLHGPRSIEGRVQDDLDHPLEGAVIRVSASALPDAPPREVLSDAHGRFRVADLPIEVLTIEVTRVGHEGKEHTLRADDAVQLTFVLPRQGELAIALRDSPGQRVDGAEVVLTGPGIWPAQAATTNERGEHVFKGLGAGEYRVRARLGARIAPSSTPLAVIPGERTTADLVLGAGARLTGTVFDQQTGDPIAGAQVAIQDLTPGIDAFSVSTDARGSFEAVGLWPGSSRVDVHHRGYASFTRDLSLPTDDKLEVALSAAASIGGVVVDERGQPLALAHLSVTTREGLPLELGDEPPRDRPGGELGVTRGPVPAVPLVGSAIDAFALGTLATDTDRSGAFHIAELAPRALILHVARSGYVPTRVFIDELEPREDRRDLRVVLSAAGKVVGRIVDARGRGLSAVYVAARTSQAEQSGITDANGAFAIGGVVGDVLVEAQPDGHTTLRCRAKVAPREEAHCDLTAATAVHELPVRVTDEYGLALEGAVVTLTAGAQHTSTQVSRRDGTLRLRELPPPPYTLQVSLPGRLSSERAVDTADREVVVRLGRSATLAGSVVDALGRAVPGALVGTNDDNSDISAETDARGAFSLEDVAPGPHELVAQHPMAGTGRAAVVRARPSERLDGVRIVLSGRYQPTDGGSGVAARKGASTPAEEKKPRNEPVIEQRGRVLVVAQLPASNALAKAGVRVGDVLLAIDDEPPLSAAHARGLLRDPPGRSAVIRVLRNKRPVNLRFRRPGP